MSARMTVKRFALAFAAALPLLASAGGHLSTCGNSSGVNGTPVTYASPSTVSLNYDQGVLGNRTKAASDAIVTSAVSLWTNVTTATVSLTVGTPIPVDVTPANFSDYDFFQDGAKTFVGNPVIYDSDGSILESVYGIGASDSILGFAGSWRLTCANYSYGEVVLNGKPVLGGSYTVTDATMTTTIAHEVGHLIGLDHTQLDNVQGGIVSNGSRPLMYPVAYRTLNSLHEDDIAAITSLYPDTNVNTAYGQLTGNFTTVAGTPIKGANIFAMGTGGSFSVVSDFLEGNTGYFRLYLPPGTYTLRAGAVNTSYTGGSRVGPYSANWNGASFQPPLYSGAGSDYPNPTVTPTGPMSIVALGGGTPTQITISAGCVATTTFRIDGTGTVGGNCVGTVPSDPRTSNPSGTIATTTPTYLWSAVVGATSYDLLVQTAAGADVFLINYTISAAGCPGGSGACAATPANALTNGASYNWFVRARNAAGASGWSAARPINVSTASIPAVPVPAQPNGTIATLSPTYLWTPSPGATGYNVRLSNSGGEIFNVALTLAQAGCPSNAGACAYTSPTPLTNAVAYTWQVSGSNAAGASAFSAGMPFTTNAVSVPSVPVPSQPNGTISNTTPTYLWTPSPGATGYTVMLTGTGGFTTTLTLTQAGCPSNAGACGYVQPSALVPGSYSWQVRANNGAGSSAFSTAMPFTVAGSSIPAPPALGAPNSANTTLTPMYLWTPSAGATGYTLRVQTTTGTVVINQVLTLSQAGCPTNAGACGLTPATSLTAGTSYTWQVAASNAAGTSAFSTATAFSTAAGGSPPAVPAPGAPNGGNVTLANGADLPFFLWTPSPGATAYTFRLHAADGTVLSTSTSSTLAQVGCPTNAGACGVSYGYSYVGGTTYQWSIRAENASGASAYSTPRSFTIVYASGTPPLPPVLGNPAGMIGNTTPFYLWTPSASATGYTVKVMSGATVIFSTALTLSQASCPSNAGACGYTAPSPLTPASSYTWQVSASNASGSSAFSSPTAFFTP